MSGGHQALGISGYPGRHGSLPVGWFVGDIFEKLV
jgi:hypothetical protein